MSGPGTLAARTGHDPGHGCGTLTCATGRVRTQANAPATLRQRRVGTVAGVGRYRDGIGAADSLGHGFDTPYVESGRHGGGCAVAG
jgi:hypothetical protein